MKPASEYRGGILPAKNDLLLGDPDCHAFTLGHKKAANGKWPIQHIWVFNHGLAVALEKFFDGHWYLDPTSFSAPFIPIIQRWREYQALIEGEDNVVTKSLLAYLRKEIYPDIRADLQAYRNIDRTGYLSFQHVALIFVPGEYVICCTDDGCTLGGTLGDVTLIEHADTSLWRFKVNHFDWDGKRRVARTEVYHVRFYTGTRLPEDLLVCPLNWYPHKKSIKRALINRGRTFERLKEGTHSMQYNGRARDPDSPDMNIELIESSVLVSHACTLVNKARTLTHQLTSSTNGSSSPPSTIMTTSGPTRASCSRQRRSIPETSSPSASLMPARSASTAATPSHCSAASPRAASTPLPRTARRT